MSKMNLTNDVLKWEWRMEPTLVTTRTICVRKCHNSEMALAANIQKEKKLWKKLFFL